MLDTFLWLGEPVRFWGAVVFVFGCIVGSFLNVCIHRMPREMGLMSPGSHCPKCGTAIPWYRNLPVVTWLWQRGRCAECSARIPARYLLVEVLTGVAFLAAFLLVWLKFRTMDPFPAAAMTVGLCTLLAGLITATFIDFEHYIIPDEITIGGMVVGVFFSLLAPELHETFSAKQELTRLAAGSQALLGLAVGAGVVYGMVRLGKALFGRQEFAFEEPARVVFTEHELHLPDEVIPYEDIFYRASDRVVFQAERLELVDKCVWDQPVVVSADVLKIGEQELDPETVLHMEVVTGRIVVPREAMGFGDVKFMGAIGAFLGWHAAVFTLMLSAVVGSVVGVGSMVLSRGEGPPRLPYGPYLALAAVVWMFGGYEWWHDWWSQFTELEGKG